MKVRYIFIGAIAFGALAIWGLRYNNLHALKLKNQVLTKDAQHQDVKNELKTLRNFVFTHMNASTRVELTGAYDQAVAKAKSGQRSDVYSQAQATCDKQGVSSIDQAHCVQRYLAKNLKPLDDNAVDKSAYIYAFASPALSFDVAGFSLIIAVVLTVASLVLYSLRLFNSRPEPTL